MSEQLLTAAEAGKILGMSESGVRKLVRAGRLTRRAEGTRDPNARGIVDRIEVERLAATRVELAAANARWHEERAADHRAKVDARGYDVVDGARHYRPPDNEHEWLDTDAVARMLDVTTQAVAQRCRRHTIPAVRAGQKWWVRADHARIAANARAADGPEAVAIALDGID